MKIHHIQSKILKLIEGGKDINKMTLREVGKEIGEFNCPQKIKHHIYQLKKKGFLENEERIKPYQITTVGGVKVVNIPIVNPYEVIDFLKGLK